MNDPHRDTRAMAEARAEFGSAHEQLDSRHFAGKLVLLVLLVAAGALLVRHGSLWSTACGVILLGLMYAHALELQHEALHSIGFRGRRANVVAGVLLGIPMLTGFSAYRAAHMRHHRYLGTPDNREYFDYGDQYGHRDRTRARTALAWVYRFSMISLYRQFLVETLRLASGRSVPGEKPATVRDIRRDHLVITAVLVMAVTVSVATGSTFAVWAWLVPVLLVAGPVHAAVELPEHYRCETGTTDVFRNTRTIRSNRLMAWYTNGNNFHVEHHLMPSLPIAHLGRLQRITAPRALHYHRTYRDFYRSLRAAPDRAPLAGPEAEYDTPR
ncbi:fatty acid desaturase family protein [Streptomyces fuscichromogenes]|uniref:fatty acid desaturase family protein n=1 Tax=Streptomyces fuscichromogenes TaxID=1324013 RepID=UPI0037F4308B